ncbi:MAG TPA: c-type cytochrome domain-containing protein [Gallionella sp.]
MKIKMWLGALLATLSVNAWATGDVVEQEAMKVLAKEEVSFKNDVMPVLQDHCISCHQPGGKGYVKSGLDLTSYQGLMKGTIYGPVVIPGNSGASTFTKLLTGTNKGLKMPMGLNPEGTLARQYILLLRNWVAQGAKNN